MRLSDIVPVGDAGRLFLRGPLGKVAERLWGDEKSVVEVEGWVKIVARERGKLVRGGHREGHNTWTNTGREYIAQRIALQSGTSNFYRTDAVAYIGVGTGTQLETASVTQLVTPVEYAAGLFLADITTTDFPLYPMRTTVQFNRTFVEGEISTSGTVNMSEVGLYTNGNPGAVPAYSFGTRVRTLAASGAAAPVAYKTFDPFGKTTSMQLEVSWQVRL